MTGFINIDKKEGVSSAFAVARIKRKTGLKCGHMGTLDPLASGVLPIALGKATRLFDYLLVKEKTYLAEFTFGSITDTLDRGGQVLEENGFVPDINDITRAAKELTGEILQTPPLYSAKHVNGARGYQLARQGAQFELPPKKVIVSDIAFIGQTGENSFGFNITCGGGTYIRSIARDIGVKTGALCYMSALRRTKSGIFSLENSVTLEEFENAADISRFLIKSEKAVDFPALYLPEEQSAKLKNGIKQPRAENDGLYRVFDTEFLGIGEVKNSLLKIKSFLL